MTQTVWLVNDTDNSVIYFRAPDEETKDWLLNLLKAEGYEPTDYETYHRVLRQTRVPALGMCD